jgi:hypothetical protein
VLYSVSLKARAKGEEIVAAVRAAGGVEGVSLLSGFQELDLG